MSSPGTTVDWCSVRICPPSPPSVNSSEITPDSDVGSGSNDSCIAHGYPFCVNVLIYTINDSHVRVYDLVLVFFNALFLLVLLIRMAPTIKKLIRSYPLFKMLYTMVFVIPIMTLIHGVISMALGYEHMSAKVTQVLVRGSILMTEISVVVFGLFFKSYAEQLMRLCFTVFVIIVLSAMFTLAEGLSEFLKDNNNLVCHELELFTHGGMLFLFTTSVIFASVYLLIFVMYMLGLSKRWNFPSKKSFYRYALILSLVNLLQAIGSMLWYTGKKRKGTGSAGICITTATTFIYLTTFAPVVYWIFLKNYFRMNKPRQSGGSAINTSTEEKRSTPRRSGNLRFSKPTLISKRSSYFEEQTMIEEDMDSSVSSYGSFRDEEIFSKFIK